MSRRVPLTLAFYLLVSAGAVRGEDTAAGNAFFEKKIRPVLVAECYSCHSTENGKKVRGGLALDSRSGTRKGGDSGPILTPGNPTASAIVKALRHTDPDFAMPPKKKLDDAVIRDFEEWIEMGAPDPRRDDAAPPEKLDIERGRSHWSFQPLSTAAAPTVSDSAWARNDIDRFLLAALTAKGLAPVADADPRTLLRRLTFDLTGLPPTPAEVEAFVADASPAALERVVDRLLETPQYGEKWARHWLDVARYAESTGKTVNFAYPHAWRYRDYVITAFNQDKPYDQFILEQLAGDLLQSNDAQQRMERTIATGFLAIGPKTLNERNGLKFELDVVDEQIDVTTQAFLGITVACARCHDHKFDPIPQKDYYALAGIFRSTETCYGTVRFVNAQRPGGLIALPAEAQPVVAMEKLDDRERKRIEEQIKSVRETMENAKDQTQRFLISGQLSLLQARLDAYDASGEPKLQAMGVRDKPSGPIFPRQREFKAGPGGFSFASQRTIGDSPVYTRGEAEQPSETRVPRGTLQVMSSEPLRITARSSGRLELAQWIASRDNPLTARVFVNRVWLQLFGRGLVPTADDFGFAGRPPTHPELLDHLARHFMDNGWSVKKLVKYVVLSHAYRLGSNTTPQALELDPDNTLLWRMSPRRLDAECLRDAILAVSGQLDRTPPVGSVVARVGDGPINRPRVGGDAVMSVLNDPRDTHRSIYLPIIRDNLPESLALFDAADPTLITADRPQTTVPSQGLYLLNNAFVLRAADAAADQLLKVEDANERIQAAYLRFYGRPPAEKERASAAAFLARYRAQAEKDGVGPLRREREVWNAFCQALLASAEFQFRR